MYSEYVEGISAITNSDPGADVLISSILPRVPCIIKSFDGLNAEIMDLNNRLCKLENDAPHIMFMDIFVTSWQTIVSEKNYTSTEIKQVSLSMPREQRRWQITSLMDFKKFIIKESSDMNIMLYRSTLLIMDTLKQLRAIFQWLRDKKSDVNLLQETHCHLQKMSLNGVGNGVEKVYGVKGHHIVKGWECYLEKT